jgi:hypothetical protein
VAGLLFYVCHFSNFNKKNMKAKVKYNSYIGTSAADISETINLKQLLVESGYDGNRYEPLGLDLVIDSGNLAVYVICIDKLNIDLSSRCIVKCLLNISDANQLFKLFNALNVTLLSSHINLSDVEIANCKNVYIEKDTSYKHIEEPDIELGVS